MSWYSDKEPFNEYDPPWCKYCDGGESKEECDRCCERHIRGVSNGEDIQSADE